MLHCTTHESSTRSRNRKSASKKPNGKRDRKRREAPTISRRIGKHDCNDLVCDYLEALGTPRALTVWLLFKYGWRDSSCHNQLVTLTIDPHDYGNPERFRRDYAATKFLSKCADLNTGIDTNAVAIEGARKAELICRRANLAISAIMDDPERYPAYHDLVGRIRKIIARILGDVRDFDLTANDVGWSSGRTTMAYADRVAGIYKYSCEPDVTPSATWDAVKLLVDSPLWIRSAFFHGADVDLLEPNLALDLAGWFSQVTTRGNIMMVVPKNAKTGRVICYEPHMNIRLQLAVGNYMRGRLRRVGVDLNDQSINQRRARIGALIGRYATIDLSMASDTISYAVVSALLPPEWFELLDRLRCRRTLWPDGIWRTNAKFSSMGNGFTFELESLIFYAISVAVAGRDVSVYGDDIIVPTAKYAEVVDALNGFGFTINATKSYATSDFRESCGCDVFRGADCTPVYLKRLPKRIEDVVKLHNQVRAFCARDVGASTRWRELMLKWRTSHSCYHGPQGYGDGHYHVDLDAALHWGASPHRLSSREGDFVSGVDGWWFKTYSKCFFSNSLYGDRVDGHFPFELGDAALCVATGPKSARSVYDSSADRQQFKYRKTWALTPRWESIIWS